MIEPHTTNIRSDCPTTTRSVYLAEGRQLWTSWNGEVKNKLSGKKWFWVNNINSDLEINNITVISQRRRSSSSESSWIISAGRVTKSGCGSRNSSIKKSWNKRAKNIQSKRWVLLRRISYHCPYSYSSLIDHVARPVGTGYQFNVTVYENNKATFYLHLGDCGIRLECFSFDHVMNSLWSGRI